MTMEDGGSRCLHIYMYRYIPLYMIEEQIITKKTLSSITKQGDSRTPARIRNVAYLLCL